MPLSQEDLKELDEQIAKCGLPVAFNGDRLDAFRLGISTAVQVLAPLVSADEGKKG